MKVDINPYEQCGLKKRMCVEIEDHDVWSLDYTLALIIHPALKKFKERNKSYPIGLTAEEWDGHLDKMIEAFAHIIDLEVEWSPMLEREKQELIREGVELFGKWYPDLWS